MQYRHIHYMNYEPGTEDNIILDAGVYLANQPEKENFLLKAASFICRNTMVDYVGIAMLNLKKNQLTTCVLMNEDRVLENVTYSVKGTPCDEVLIHRFCYYPYGVMERFPNDQIVQKLKIKSYLGTLLLSNAGEPIGVVELMDTKTIENPAFVEHLVLILSPAIEEEISKLKYEE